MIAAVVGIAFEEIEGVQERPETLKAFVTEENIQYLVLDGGYTQELYESLPTLEGFRGFPTMIIMGRDGAVTHANTVFVPRELPKIREEVERALGGDKSEG